MATWQIDTDNALYYEYHPPASDEGCTFVFFNALTGDTGTWETMVGPTLRGRGHGTLAYNFRGQAGSFFASGVTLDADLIAADAVGLLGAVAPARPVLVGLSIGGLFAARAWLKGTDAIGLVLINTLRNDGPRLKWIGDALVRAVEVGGLELFRDLFLPLLFNEEWQAVNRENFLKPEVAYTPLDPENGHYKLLAEAGRTADWDLPYEKLDLPVLVITGLQDHVFLEKGVVKKLSARLPQGRRVDLPEAGHLIPAEHPDLLADLLFSFAEEVS